MAKLTVVVAVVVVYCEINCCADVGDVNFPYVIR